MPLLLSQKDPVAMSQVAIIGAGVAGLAAARALLQRNVAVSIYEKSRGTGGRATARRVHGCIIDHGAQVVQTPTRPLLALMSQRTRADLQAMQEIGLPIWTFDATGTVQPGDPSHNAAPRWYWPDGMSSLSKHLAHELDIYCNTPMQWLEATPDGYHLYDTNEQLVGTAHKVLLTPPGPQTADLLAASALPPELQAFLLGGLASAIYRRCLSVALFYPQRPDVPWYALVNLDRQHDIAWLACEHCKVGHVPDQSGLLLAQMSDAFSTRHWDEASKGTVGEAGTALPPYVEQIHQQVCALVDAPLDRPHWADVHRWRYSQPNSGADFDLLNNTGSGLYFAGDYVVGRGRIHEAIQSGWQVAELMG